MESHSQYSETPTLAEYFSTLQERAKSHNSMTLNEILKHFGSKSHLVFIALLSIPFNQPVPLFGLSTPIGIVMAIVAGFYVFNRPPKIPKKFAELKIPQKTLLKICEVAILICKKIEKFIKPRFLREESKVRRVVVGVMIIICSLLLCLPLPIPFSNAIPSWTTTLLCFSEMESDGVLMSTACLMFIGTIVFFSLLVLGPIYGFQFYSHQ